MSNLYWLSQITAEEQFLVGEKVFLLSQFLQCNFPIMPGFALGSSVFQEFLATIDNSRFLIGNLPQSSLHLNTDNYQALQSVATKSRSTIIETAFSEALQAKIFAAAQRLNSPQLILRPSLVVPNDQQWGNSGLLRSQIIDCHPEAITIGIKQVWADLFSAKSLLYWDKLGIDLPQIKCTILIQAISNAIASGTVEVQSQKGIIQANWGLGHSLQRGEVDPDRYVVDLATATIISQKVGLKTHGYRLHNGDSATESRAVLESYLIEESDREKLVLETSQIDNLIQLINNIIRENPQIRYCEWTLLPQKTNASRVNFWLTKLSYDTPTLISTQISTQDNLSLPTQASSENILLRGIGAARGTVTAEVVVYNSSSNYGDRHRQQVLENQIAPGAILVVKTIQPQDIPLLRNVGGIITEVGGQTSHGAILARELGIPAIVGATNAVAILNRGDLVTLDGDLGVVYAATQPFAIAKNERKQTIREYYTHQVTDNVPLATQLMVNLSQPDLIEQTASLPVDGVGLLRGEFMLLELLSQRSLKEWLQPEYQTELLDYLTATIRKFTVGFAPRPIYYRSLDFPLSARKEANSVLGIRGTAAYLIDPTFFQLELTALARVMAEGNQNLKLILPFVRSLREWQFCRDLVEKAGLTSYPDFQLWMMAEIPSVMLMLPEYIAAGVEGIAIGMNDLTQLLLGIDREQAGFARQGLDSNSLPVQKAIAKLIETAKTDRIPCSICLSASHSNPQLIDKLVRWGITTISVEPQAIVETYRAIARAEKRLLLNLSSDL